MNLRFAKVKASSHFDDVMIPWNSFWTGKNDVDGCTEGCVLTGSSKNNEP
jgi:hypothetical protein